MNNYGENALTDVKIGHASDERFEIDEIELSQG